MAVHKNQNKEENDNDIIKPRPGKDIEAKIRRYRGPIKGKMSCVVESHSRFSHLASKLKLAKNSKIKIIVIKKKGK